VWRQRFIYFDQSAMPFEIVYHLSGASVSHDVILWIEGPRHSDKEPQGRPVLQRLDGCGPHDRAFAN
jgi:hypothetical protein